MFQHGIPTNTTGIGGIKIWKKSRQEPEASGGSIEHMLAKARL
jgi:hypothetical protein